MTTVADYNRGISRLGLLILAVFCILLGAAPMFLTKAWLARRDATRVQLSEMHASLEDEKQHLERQYQEQIDELNMKLIKLELELTRLKAMRGDQPSGGNE